MPMHDFCNADDCLPDPNAVNDVRKSCIGMTEKLAPESAGR